MRKIVRACPSSCAISSHCFSINSNNSINILFEYSLHDLSYKTGRFSTALMRSWSSMLIADINQTARACQVSTHHGSTTLPPPRVVIASSLPDELREKFSAAVKLCSQPVRVCTMRKRCEPSNGSL